MHNTANISINFELNFSFTYFHLPRWQLNSADLWLNKVGVFEWIFVRNIVA